jgi:hypothetical protein
MVPLVTEIVIGSITETLVLPNVGDADTFATGGAVVVALGDAGEVLLRMVGVVGEEIVEGFSSADVESVPDPAVVVAGLSPDDSPDGPATDELVCSPTPPPVGPTVAVEVTMTGDPGSPGVLAVHPATRRAVAAVNAATASHRTRAR